MGNDNTPLDLSVLTDLAVESRNLAVERTGGEIEGVTLDEEQVDDAKITRIQVMNQQAAKAIGKKPGNYITIESEGLRQGQRPLHEYLSGVMADELNHLIHFENLNKNSDKEPTILVIGLGNWNATPDALGPRVAHHLLVTRHLYDAAPIEAREGMRPVCALAPGVLGLTGIETAEILKGVIDKVHPDLVIAVDSLAARESKHLASTIQISDTGIYPGSGLGKKRIGITREDMGVPVVALGVPTVINSVTIVSDTIDKIKEHEQLAGTDLNNRLQQINEEQKEEIINQILQPYLGDLIMAPKGIDKIIKDVGRVVAGGLNVALHPDIKEEDVSMYLQ
ncbi:GPR endopeptidase [Selenihalanaerobacter shriftii]|uniref:Germination protease n=1 Tax=Selenihalanaerobacter shriftii TaxID=142842 RepID=A0A1T4PYM1_9FIRM|nr:GPR endopeptidase [Selenihalanaerobacter shriftii]SJZ96613.1 spore protease [Selenihalanaerobacter shriftii]